LTVKKYQQKYQQMFLSP